MGFIAYLILAALGILVAKYRRRLYISLICLPRDLKFVYRGVSLMLQLRWAHFLNLTAGKLLERSVDRTPDKICFYCEDETMTFRQVDDLSNKIANFFLAKGYKKGDVLALLMDNRVEYPAIWLGLSKIGVITALINYNLRLRPLLHCVQVAKAKGIIYGKDFASAIQEIVDLGELADIDFYSFDSGATPAIPRAQTLAIEFKNVSAVRPKPKETVGFSDKLLYVYTSGTTGLPKAAVIKNLRFMMAAMGGHHIQGIQRDDILMTPLPVYHMAGGVLGVGQAIIYSTSVVITKKFSASRFWKDCIKYNVSVTQYLGELCRFLLAQPKTLEEKQHQLRLMVGNGMRAEIWHEFIDRFNIPKLAEFYGATEGNCQMTNFDGHPGAIGFFPAFTRFILPIALVRVDEVTGEVLRDPKTGLAIECAPGELGELVAQIQRGHPVREFPGYTDQESSKKKILKDVFKKGDSAFRAGDVMVKDELGYYYFRDRVGDTFRWKGENVSTMEVEAVLASYCDRKDVAVYGVQIPGTDGRAGMAAVADPEGEVDLAVLAKGLKSSLPPYARPVFIRIIEKMELTGTFKLQKMDLQKDGINIDVIKDMVFILQADNYIPLDKELHSRVMSGQIRL
ncbi:unnamed protein product [Allacma fusca]|uniref:Very long-chain fatty acid transport protein n=1 Tax=Allacma fusca TaxID=39272 RepID=A0A8J2KHI0_9HEXA|nr:unnamed protein product [Allacma fusca]